MSPRYTSSQTFAQMAEEFQLGERDVVLTNEFIYTPFMKDLGLKCHYVFQEKFGPRRAQRGDDPSHVRRHPLRQL